MFLLRLLYICTSHVPYGMPLKRISLYRRSETSQATLSHKQLISMNHMLIIVYFYLSIMAYSYQAGILMMHGVNAYHYPFKIRAFKTVNAHISIAVGFPCCFWAVPHQMLTSHHYSMVLVIIIFCFITQLRFFFSFELKFVSLGDCCAIETMFPCLTDYLVFKILTPDILH